MEPRYAKIYVTDIRVDDRIKKQRDGEVWRVVAKYFMEPGRYRVTASDGPNEYTWTSRSDTSQVWIEIP